MIGLPCVDAERLAPAEWRSPDRSNLLPIAHASPEPLGLPAIRLILVDRSEIGFLSHCLPSPFSVTEANGSQVEFVPWRSQKEKALSLPLIVRMHPDVRRDLARTRGTVLAIAGLNDGQHARGVPPCAFRH